MKARTRTWLVTGAAGFIGSHLAETLLNYGQKVIGIDNFSTGKKENLKCITNSLTEIQKKNFSFVEGDINDAKLLDTELVGVEIILHQAALGSVPRSVEDPLATNHANVNGFLTLLCSAKNAGVKRIVYASSSSVYGDDPGLPKIESKIGSPLSPYAASKLINEIYAKVFQQQFKSSIVGLRYFNVFGPRQDPRGEYAAVIPRWIDALARARRPVIFGDGSSSRDFCYVENVVSANLLAALSESSGVYNIGTGGRTTLNELYQLIATEVSKATGKTVTVTPQYQDFRAGDVVHSQADISKAVKELGYNAGVLVPKGIERTVLWFLQQVYPK